MRYNTIVLGAGISAIALSVFGNRKLTFIEKENKVGGLCRSFKFDEVNFDIGPHIIFSKHSDILQFMIELEDMKKIKRSNQIFFNNKFIKYPFENNLYNLTKVDKDYCLKTFLNNPYKKYQPENMLQFFLSNFGEGITRLYLEPYNKKIWKYDPSLLDLQMVNRIPRPPDEDIINSYKGIKSEGYKHQLFFFYPKKGGIESIIKSLLAKGKENIQAIHKSQEILSIEKKSSLFKIKTSTKDFTTQNLISTIPINKLISLLKFKVPNYVKEAANNLLSNSIYITMLKLKSDNLKNNFTFTIPDQNIIFHRINKLNFINDEIKNSKYSYILVETTFRNDINLFSKKTINKRVVDDLNRLKLINNDSVLKIKTFEFQDAYVIYDLHHKQNTDIVKKYLKSVGINVLGRFGKFKYINSDQALFEAREFCNQFLS